MMKKLLALFSLVCSLPLAAQDYTKIYPNGARHKCTICGRTELDDPNLEFRYCSKCEGSHEYCQDHLFTHKHIKNGVPAEPQG